MGYFGFREASAPGLYEPLGCTDTKWSLLFGGCVQESFPGVKGIVKINV